MARPVLWKPFVVAASYAFAAAANWRFCLLLGGVTLVNQAAARALARRPDDERARKRIVAAAVGVDLLALGVFKYYGFFVEDILGVLDSVGLGAPLPLMTIA